MAAGWVYQGWPGSFPLARAAAQPLNLGIACLADAHLPDGNPSRPEALSLARAVAEIRSLTPVPRLALLAGDLAHDGDASALALGREILSDLPMPILAVRGEGDGSPGKGDGGQLFGKSRFFYTCEGVNLLGLDTVWQDGPYGPGFTLGEAQPRWLAEILVRVDPAIPLIVLSHAPLTPIYRPWGQWTVDSGPLLDQLTRFEQVLCLHGHVHHGGGVFAHGQATPGKSPPPLVGGGWGEREISPWPGPGLARFTPSPTLPHQRGGSEDGAWRGFQHVSLPATSWPLPSPLAGTPQKLRPGLGPRGCGWAFLSQGGGQSQFRQVLWQA